MDINDVKYLGILGMPTNRKKGNSCENNMSGWRIETPIIDLEKCKTCGLCVTFCPDISITIKNEYPVVNYLNCKGCGICATECPKQAITMVKE